VGFDLINKLKNGLLPGQPKTSKNGQLGLQDFYNTATDRGFARDFHLRVTQIGDSTLGNEDLIYIRSATIPDREIVTDSVFFRGFKYNVPLTSSYPGSDNWTVEILMDKQYEIYNTIEKWQRDHFNEGTFIGREMPTFDKMIELMAVDDQLNVVKKFRLYGCFPRKIGAIKYNMGGQGAPVSLELSLAYQYWTSEDMPLPAAEKQGLIDKFLGGLRKVTGVVQGGRNVIRSVRSIPSL
jgi:hypothetical protein